MSCVVKLGLSICMDKLNIFFFYESKSTTMMIYIKIIMTISLKHVTKNFMLIQSQMVKLLRY